jgi:hypothetical protein
MEHVAETGTGRKLQAVRHLADALEDAERPSISRPELALGAWLQRLGGAVKKAKSHPLTDHQL